MKSSRPDLRFAAVALISLASLAAPGATLWNETSQGDLSGNRLAPTGLSLDLGSNDLFATTQGGDLEYLTFQIPAGRTISSIYLRAYAGTDGRAFLGIQQGTTFTVPANTAAPGDMYGYSHFGTSASGATVGTDFLGQIGSAFGAQGFTPPLTSGNYTVWLQQLGAPATYQLDFVVSAVPEPATTAVCAAALLLGFTVLRRRTASAR
jgi:hypothetical protein